MCENCIFYLIMTNINFVLLHPFWVFIYKQTDNIVHVLLSVLCVTVTEIFVIEIVCFHAPICMICIWQYISKDCSLIQFFNLDRTWHYQSIASDHQLPANAYGLTFDPWESWIKFLISKFSDAWLRSVFIVIQSIPRSMPMHWWYVLYWCVCRKTVCNFD